MNNDFFLHLYAKERTRELSEEAYRRQRVRLAMRPDEPTMRARFGICLGNLLISIGTYLKKISYHASGSD